GPATVGAALLRVLRGGQEGNGPSLAAASATRDRPATACRTPAPLIRFGGKAQTAAAISSPPRWAAALEDGASRMVAPAPWRRPATLRPGHSPLEAASKVDSPPCRGTPSARRSGGTAARGS